MMTSPKLMSLGGDLSSKQAAKTSTWNNLFMSSIYEILAVTHPILPMGKLRNREAQ